MRQLVIIGNGFDLAHGLKTSYQDFIIWYLNKAISKLRAFREYEDDIIRLNAKVNIENIELVIKDYSDFESFFYNNNSLATFNNKYIKASEFLKSTANGWVDVEKYYFESLVRHYEEYSRSKDLVGTKKRLRELNAFIHNIKDHLYDYLKEVETDLSRVKKVAFSTFHSRVYGYGEKSDIFFINFNYTNTLDHYVFGTHGINVYRVDIHGNINDSAESLIFGYGDDKDERYRKIEETDIDDFLKHMKSFWYLRDSQYGQIMNFIDSGDFQVKIAGHSCGLSDKVLLSEIFTHKHCKEIEIFYHDRGNGEDDYIEKCYAISRQFPHDQKEAMRKKIRTKDQSIPLVRNSGNVS